MTESAIPQPIAEGLQVLLIDDNDQVRLVLERTLTRAGYLVTTESDVPAACLRLRTDTFDVVVTDLHLPSGTGLDILMAAHRVDPTLPVVFVTGAGDLATAQHALDQGALRYLVKPVRAVALLGAISEACRARAATSGTNAALSGSIRGPSTRVSDDDVRRVILARDFNAALERLWMATQPVAAMSTRQIVAHEALVRGDEPSLARPDLLIAAAEELGRLPELGQRIRAACARLVPELDAGVDLLVNLHPSDLTDDDLFDAEAPLSKVASRVILELTERASLDELVDVQPRIAALRALGYRLAIDDLGAGYGSLSTMAMLRPDLVKLDMSLIRGIDADPVRARMVRSLGAMCTQLGIPWLCEGIETIAELRTLMDMGADLIQGYLLARPTRQLGGVDTRVYDLAPRRQRRTSSPLLPSQAKALCRDAARLATESSAELQGVLSRLGALVDQLVE